MRKPSLLLASATLLAAQAPPPALPTSSAPTSSANVVTSTPDSRPRAGATEQVMESFPLLDDGLLDLKWFGPGIVFTKGDAIDFFWIKPGLNLTGSTLAFEAWDDPVYLRPGRDSKDKERAQKLSDSFPGLIMRGLEPAFGQRIKASRRDGDYRLIGRVVDANAKSTGARFFAPGGIGAAETVTWDFKILDVKGHEVVAAFHHRVVSATVMSTIDSKIGKWLKEFGPFLVGKAAL